METISSNDALYADRGHEIVAASTALLVLPTLAVCLRLASRWMSRAGFWWDDYTVVLAMVFAWAPNIVNLIAMHHGFGKHLEFLPPSAVFTWFKMLYAFEFLYAAAITTVKFSIILFQYRIFPVMQYRRILMGALAFVTLFTISCILVSIFQCIPIHDFWDTFAGQLSPELGGHCIQVELYFIVSGSINTVTDFILLAMPIPLLWRLRTSNLQKLILTGIFTVGLTVCAVSIVRLVVLSQLQKADITWNYVPAAIWTAAEPSIAVVSACLPSLRPLFVRVVWGRSHRPKAASRSGPKSLTTSWRSGKANEGSFNRLQDSSLSGSLGPPKPWTNNVAVYGGQDNASEEFEIGGSGRLSTPRERIRVKTTVTVSETVDWQDDLF